MSIIHKFFKLIDDLGINPHEACMPLLGAMSTSIKPEEEDEIIQIVKDQLYLKSLEKKDDIH